MGNLNIDSIEMSSIFLNALSAIFVRVTREVWQRLKSLCIGPVRHVEKLRKISEIHCIKRKKCKDYMNTFSSY